MIDLGLGGPKARPKGVVDGQTVNIPSLLLISWLLTFSEMTSVLMDWDIPGSENCWDKGIGETQLQDVRTEDLEKERHMWLIVTVP